MHQVRISALAPSVLNTWAASKHIDWEIAEDIPVASHSRTNPHELLLLSDFSRMEYRQDNCVIGKFVYS